MKLTEKAKRYLLVLGGILLCAGLLVAIWFQLKPEAVPEERFEAETGEVTEITVDMEQEEEKGQGAQNGDGIVETEPESLQALQQQPLHQPFCSLSTGLYRSRFRPYQRLLPGYQPYHPNLPRSQDRLSFCVPPGLQGLQTVRE